MLIRISTELLCKLLMHKSIMVDNQLVWQNWPETILCAVTKFTLTIGGGKLVLNFHSAISLIRDVKPSMVGRAV